MNLQADGPDLEKVERFRKKMVEKLERNFDRAVQERGNAEDETARMIHQIAVAMWGAALQAIEKEGHGQDTYGSL